jgi:hypothetical protein
VRLLFCLFADDTGIFTPAQSFRDWLEAETKPDGSDMGRALAELFDVLNTAEHARQHTQRDNFASFPYINGSLFAETHRPSAFDAKTRELLLDACALDWTNISPAIFGALFQSIISGEDRRKLGAHYTSEENILKLIKPLFLDELWAEFELIKRNKGKLFEFQKRLRTLAFFDPACGCGNFLVIAYRELRLLEVAIMRAVRDLTDIGTQSIFEANLHQELSVNVDQFYGIEIEEFPAQIAQVAMWLTDHQMNRMVSDEFGAYYARIPLVSTAHIRHGNALRTDWNEVLPAERCSFLLGNPPFVGAMVMKDSQREDTAAVFVGLRGYGVLDYVCAWYWKAATYMDGHLIEAAFVSTNSISQGEQVGLLWAPLIHKYRLHINFAHQTFRWSNEATGNAAVHCVIIGFAQQERSRKTIYEYETVVGEAHAVTATTISPYLVDAPTVLLGNRLKPVCSVPQMRFGSMPRDGGALVLSSEERDELIAADPEAADWIRPYTGAQEFLSGYTRFCLWLLGMPPSTLRRLPRVIARIEAVKRFREASKASSTRKFAATPTLFCQIAQPQSDYILVPRVSSERRRFIPMAVVTADVIANDQVMTIENGGQIELGILSSTMHNAWVRYTCGRLESRYRYSKDIVYNNFPWPDLTATAASPLTLTLSREGRGDESEQAVEKRCAQAAALSAKLATAIESAAQGVLDARAAHPESSLADLYDPVAMPPDLTKAHQKLDAAVDAAYFAAHAADGAKKSWRNDAERVAFLFTLYQKFTSLLPLDAAKSKRIKTRG